MSNNYYYYNNYLTNSITSTNYAISASNTISHMGNVIYHQQPAESSNMPLSFHTQNGNCIYFPDSFEENFKTKLHNLFPNNKTSFPEKMIYYMKNLKFWQVDEWIDQVMAQHFSEEDNLVACAKFTLNILNFNDVKAETEIHSVSLYLIRESCLLQNIEL